MSFNSKLIAVLKKDRRFVDEDGELVLAAVQDHAWRIDHGLVKLLLTDKEIKTEFFDEIEGHWVFNLNTFIEYVSQKNFLDNSYTRFRNRIGLTVGGKYLRECGDVALVWPYKDCVLEGGQTKEEEKRKEIFFNEVLAEDEITRLLAPKVLTGFTRYTAKGKKPVGDLKRDDDGLLRENMILRSNNLFALYVLRKLFRGRVKMIYLDPPYNRPNEGNDFLYNDKFNHSTWMTFMKNRLEVAKELLSPEDGLLWMSISDDEAHYLKALADEVFGRDNFVADVIWNSTKSVTNTALISDAHTHNLLYASNKEWLKANRTTFRLPADESKFSNPDKDPRGKWVADPFQVGGIRKNQLYPITNPKTGEVYKPLPGNSWKNEKEVFDRLLAEGRIVFGVSGEAGPQRKRYWSEAEERGEVTTTLWSDLPTTTNATQHLKKMFGERVFDGPKPEALIQRILQLSTKKGDIVLDFFAGSGTTAATAHKMNRQWITVEQLDYVNSVTVERLVKVVKGEDGGISPSVNWQGGGEFVYCELMKYNEVFMERIEAAKTSKEMIKIWKEMAEGSFLNWYVNSQVPEDAVNNFEAIGQEEDGLKKQRRLLAELLDKNQLYVNLSEIDDPRFKVSDEDKALNKAFYGEAYNA
jgi:adenine-specific DNA-methyltransferase